MKNKPGSVLVITLIIMSLVTLLTQQLMRNSFIGAFFIKTIIAQEKAKMLAISGIEIAMAQLVDKSHRAKSGEKKEDVSLAEGKRFLQTVLPHLNRWQVYDLKEEIDGIEGQIKVCISCEEGKINLNDSFDFKKGEFKKEVALLLKGLSIKGKMAPGMLLKKVTDFLAKRKKPLIDISEILEIQGFEKLDVFYKPPVMGTNKKKSEPNIDVSLFDLFTLWTKKTSLEPLFLSDALCALLNFRRPLADDAEKYKEKFKVVIDAFEKDWGKDWDTHWKYVQVLYDQKSLIYKDIRDILSQEFEPRTYSVLSCGSVDGIQKQAVAIIERAKGSGSTQSQEVISNEKKSQKEDPNKDNEAKNSSKPFIIKKLYWV